MTAAELVADLRARGVEVITDGRRLGVRPAGVLSPAQREALLRRKAEVLRLLASPSVRPRRDYGFPWPDDLPGFGARRVVPFELCSACGSGTWVSYGSAPLCLACARGLAGEAIHGRTRER